MSHRSDSRRRLVTARLSLEMSLDQGPTPAPSVHAVTLQYGEVDAPQPGGPAVSMSDVTRNPIPEVYLSIEWVARLEAITQHHARRVAQAGGYPGAYKRGANGHWLVPLSSVARTLNGTIDHWLAQPFQSTAS